MKWASDLPECFQKLRLEWQAELCCRCASSSASHGEQPQLLVQKHVLEVRNAMQKAAEDKKQRKLQKNLGAGVGLFRVNTLCPAHLKVACAAQAQVTPLPRRSKSPRSRPETATTTSLLVQEPLMSMCLSLDLPARSFSHACRRRDALALGEVCIKNCNLGDCPEGQSRASRQAR